MQPNLIPLAAGKITAGATLASKHQSVMGCTVTQGIAGTNSITLADTSYPADRVYLKCDADFGSALIAGTATFRVSTYTAGTFVVDTLRGDTLAVWDGPWSFTVWAVPKDK